MDSQLSSVENGRGGTPGDGRKIRWASPSDWQAQKQRIADLYKHRGYPLRKVMKMMREEHDFYAT